MELAPRLFENAIAPQEMSFSADLETNSSLNLLEECDGHWMLVQSSILHVHVGSRVQLRSRFLGGLAGLLRDSASGDSSSSSHLRCCSCRLHPAISISSLSFPHWRLSLLLLAVPATSSGLELWRTTALESLVSRSLRGQTVYLPALMHNIEGHQSRLSRPGYRV